MDDRIDCGDTRLIQIVDQALAEAARKAGDWLVCRPGCTECCMGPFLITQLDARRLRRGLRALAAADPERAHRVRERATQTAARPAGRFADDEPCPALDPETGCCDLYAARPMTCRAFGPPLGCGAEAVGICELCFRGATDDEIVACQVEIDPEGLEFALLSDLEEATGVRGETTVAAALATDDNVA